MLIKNSDIKKLSADVRRIIDGNDIDLRDNREGILSILKNDIHTLANIKNEQIDALQRDRETMQNTIADISHQLKTPLTSMMVMADLIKEAPAEKQDEFVDNIKLGLNRMEWLVSALLKIAKLDAKVVEFSPEVVDSKYLIGASIEPLLVQLDIKEQRIEQSGNAKIFCDKRWTSEALGNIIKNASEHSPVGSTIAVEAGSNPICTWVSVSDGGGGLTNAQIAKVFKRFEGSRSEHGYGIGLPLALAIMRGQEGDIQVDGGDKDHGATFTLKFYKQG